MQSRLPFRLALAALVVSASSGLAHAQFNARVQAIHNSADPELAVIDFYVADQLILDDVAFRTASPFLDVPAFIPLTGGIAPGNSTGPDDVFFEFTFTLGLNQTYQFILQGVRDPGQFEPNPDGRDISLDVLVNEDARETASDPGVVEANFIHGSTDAPAMDVTWDSAFVNDLTYRDITGYESVPFVDVVWIQPADGSNGTLWLPPFPPPVPGQAVTILLSGFESPASNQNGEIFQPFAVSADGQAVLLDPFPVSIQPESALPPAFTLLGNFPNPFRDATTIRFNLDGPRAVSVEEFDALGRTVARTAPAFFALGAGREIRLDSRTWPPGTYLVRVRAGGPGSSHLRTARMTLVR